MTIHQNNFTTFFTSDYLEHLGIRHGFFTRHGGCSPLPWKSLNLATSVGDSKENVIENRRRLMDTLGLNPESIFDVWQVHSNHVVIPEKPRRKEEPHQKADAILTQVEEITLLMVFADCVPILLFDPIKKVIGIAHAGWKGTVQKIALHVIRKMKSCFQSKPSDIIAVIGPSICVTHYEVGEEVLTCAKRAFPKKSGVIQQVDARKYLDLRLANEIVLKDAGIGIIENLDICTACNVDDWFSHRGENGKAGRFGAIITLGQ